MRPDGTNEGVTPEEDTVADEAASTESTAPAEPTAEAPDTTSTENSKTEPTVSATDLLKLRDALEKERALRKDAERAAKEGQSYKARVQEIEEASKSETEKLVEAARREGEQSALARANDRVRSLEARVLAAGAQFRDPALAVRLLDLSDVKVTDDGVVDTSAIGKLLDGLAKEHPYLLAEQKPALPTPAQVGIGVQGSGIKKSPTERLKSYYENAAK